MLKKSHGIHHGCCRVEALVNVDSRGQIVLPKKLRDKAGIKDGEKLAAISWGEKDCCNCICLVKADELNKTAKDMLGPIMK